MTAPACTSALLVPQPAPATGGALPVGTQPAQPSLARKLRSRAFNALFLASTFTFVLAVYPLLLAKTREPLARALKLWSKGVLWLMRALMGIRVEIRGREHLPASGRYILASKHQSEADGIIMLSLIDDVAFVAMKEVAKYPLVGPVLRKLEMVLVDTDGGACERATLAAGGRAAIDAGRPILIYPEGRLMPVGERGRYRAGVYHLAADLGLPVIPVATDVGLCWDRRQPVKKPGTVAVSILPPMHAGADKRAFMAALEETIEAENARLAMEHALVRAGR